MAPISLGTFDDLKGVALGLSLVQARLMPMFLLVPFMNRSMVPRTISYGIAAGLGLMVLPMLPIKEIPAGPGLALLLVRCAVQIALLHEAPDPATGAPVLCVHCERVVPDMPFCSACGAAARASSRTSRRMRRESPPVRTLNPTKP